MDANADRPAEVREEAQRMGTPLGGQQQQVSPVPGLRPVRECR